MTNESEQFGHLAYLDKIATESLQELKRKDREYGASWKKRGGVGAYMMLARKWDRLENALNPHPGDKTTSNLGDGQGLPIPPYDIITAGVVDCRAEGIIDDIRDLRNYLLLVEAQIRYEQEEVIGRKTELAKADAVTPIRS